MEKKLNFKVCGLPAKYFIPFFIIVMASVYLGFMPKVKIYSNDAGTYMATSFVMTIAFLMAVGGLFFWLGNTIPIVNNYLGGACLLPLLGASFLNYVGLVPQELVNGTKVLMGGGFQDAYIAMLLVGSILVMDCKVLLGATARYMPTILGSQVFALGFCMLAGLITGYGIPEEYFAYDIDEYYESIQMGLPALYYSGRANPPHPEIWINYFLRMVKLYSSKVCDLQLASEEEDIAGGLSFLKGKEKELLQFLIKSYRGEFTPIEVSRELSVTNKTIINRLAVLVKNGFVVPILVNKRIRSYELSEFTRDHEKEIMKVIS